MPVPKVKGNVIFPQTISESNPVPVEANVQLLEVAALNADGLRAPGEGGNVVKSPLMIRLRSPHSSAFRIPSLSISKSHMSGIPSPSESGPVQLTATSANVMYRNAPSLSTS